MFVIWRLIQFAKPYRGWAVTAIMLYVIVTLANILLLGMAGWFISAMALAGAMNVAINYFTPAAFIRFLAILRTGGRYGERLITHETTFRLIAELRQWCFQRLEPLVPADLQGWHSGELVSTLRHDMQLLESAYVNVFLPCIGALFAAVLLFIVMAWYHPTFAFALFAVLSIAGLGCPMLVWCFADQVAAQTVLQKTALTQHSIDAIQGAAELQIYSAQERFTQRILHCSENLTTAQIKMQGLKTFAEELLGSCAAFSMWLMIWIAIPLLATGVLAPANLTLLALLAFASFEIVQPLPGAVYAWGEVNAAAKHLFSLTDRSPAIKATPEKSRVATQFDIVFDKVCFHYPAREEGALVNYSLNIKDGEHVMITGASGSGKTSLIHLLMRFWTPQQGSILIGGVQLAEMDLATCRSMIALAAQQPYLFADTIRANLRLAKPSATQYELENACRLAHIHEFIQSQPAQYDTQVGEYGARLSGGQKRRIGIAQALLRNAPILILDEPNEGLDKQTQIKMINDILQASNQKTVILISHQGDPAIQVDRIIHLHVGQIAE